MKPFITILLLFAFNANAQNSEDYVKSGIAKQFKLDYYEALSDFNKAIELNSKSDLAYYSRGKLKLRISTNNEALSDFNKAIELNPKYAAAYFERGLIKGELNDYLKAIAEFDKVIELDPSYYDAYLERGKNKYHLKYYNSAILDFDKAIPHIIDNTIACSFRGDAKLALLDYLGAILEYNQIIKSAEEKYLRNASWGHTSSLDDEMKEGRGYVYFCLVNRAYAKSQMKDYWGAIQDYDRCIKVNHTETSLYIGRGVCKVKHGYKQNGCLDFRKAQELGYSRATEWINKYCK
jgi:tetratricopeptide (TPR) repeat protein